MTLILRRFIDFYQTTLAELFPVRRGSPGQPGVPLTRMIELGELEDRLLFSAVPLPIEMVDSGAAQVTEAAVPPSVEQPTIQQCHNQTAATLVGASIAFDQAAGQLTIGGDERNNTVYGALNDQGFLELNVDGRQFSADANSQFYDAGLLGATREHLRSIVMSGGEGADKLSLGDFTLSHGLAVASDDGVSIDGTITAQDSLRVTAKSIEINGAITVIGGHVRLESSTTTFVEGTIDVSNHRADGRGGRIEVLGETVGLFASAVLDASGTAGGGTVLFGGDYQGRSSEFTNAKYAWIDESARINADAEQAGNGGTVIVWADRNAYFYGSISAQGGSQSGDAGFVEVSGKEYLLFRGDVDLSAEHGNTGTLLLDPANIVIANGTVDSAADGTGTFRGNNSNTVGSILISDTGPTTIYESELQGLAATVNIVLQATNNITLNDLTDNLLSLAATTGSLTIWADSDGNGAGSFSMTAGDQIRTRGGAINIRGASLSVAGTLNTTGNAGIAGGAITLVADAGSITTGVITTTGGSNAAGGAVNITASGTVTVGGTITTSGGTYSASNPGRNAGSVSITGSTVTVAAITATGRAATTAGFSGGDGGSVYIDATSGSITLGGSISTAGGNGTAPGNGGDAGDITLADAVTLTGNRTLTATGGTGTTEGLGGQVQILGTVNGNTSGTRSFTVNAGTGDVTLAGAIGATNALSALTITANDVSLANVGAAAAGVTGATNITASTMGADEGEITFTGTVYKANAQTYTAASGNTMLLSAGSLTTFTSSADAVSFLTGTLLLADGSDLTVTTAGGAISALAGIRGTSLEALTLHAGASTLAVGAIGIGDEIASVALMATTATLSGDIITGDVTGNNVTITGSVTLNHIVGTTLVIDTDNATNDGSISISGAVTGTGRNLTLRGGTIATSSITTTGGTDERGGDIDVLGSGAVSLAGAITTSGGAFLAGSPAASAGDVTLAGTSISVSAITAIGAAATGGGAAGGSGGTITLDASAGGITLGGNVVSTGGSGDGTGSGGNAGDVTLADAVTVAGSWMISATGGSGGSAGSGGDVVISGAINADTPATHSLTIDAGTGDVSLDGAIGGSGSLSGLTIAGNDTSIAAVGVSAAGVSGATSIVSADSGADTGSILLSGGVWTTGSQSFTGSGLTTISGDLNTAGSSITLGTAVVFSADAVVTAGAASISFGSTLSFGGNSLQLSADEVDFAGNVSGAGGDLVIQAGTIGTPLHLAGISAAANQLDITASEFGYIQSGLNSLSFGRSDSTASVTVYTASLTSATSIYAGLGALTIAGSIDSTNSLLLLAGSGGIALDAAIDVGANLLTLESAGGVTQSASVAASGLQLLGSGDFILDSIANDVDILAADILGSVSFSDSDELSVGIVSGTVGISTGLPGSGGSVTITAAGFLTIDEAVDTSGGSGGTLTATGTVFNASTTPGAGHILLSGLNHAPELDLDANNSSGQAGAHWTTAFIEDAGPVLIVDTDASLLDVDNSQLESASITITNLFDGASEVLAADTTGTNITAVYDSNTGLLTLTGSDTVTHYLQVLRTVTYNNTAEPPTTTTRVVTVVANDGTANSNIATVTIAITPVNDAPLATSDSFSVNEDSQLTISASGILTNDTDAEGNPLTAVLGTGPANGTLTLNADGSFTYQANANFNGTDSFTYKANDGTSDSALTTVTITVNPVNDAPIAINNSHSVNEDTQLNVAPAGVLANDTDIDSDPLSAVLVSGPANGTLTLNADGSFTYQANANFRGIDSFTYKANDGTADSNVATVSITVNPVNDAPVATNDSYSVNEDAQLAVVAAGVLVNDTDIDSDPLSAVLVSGPANGTLTLNADGSFTYQANANFHGTDSFTYKANDGTADSDEATVTITVNAVNDTPVAANDSYSVNEDAQLTVPATGVLSNDTEFDSDPLTTVLVSGPANGTLTLTADGSFTYQANANFNGTDSFTYKANDGTADSNVATVSINVNPVNDAPVATNDSYLVNEDTQLIVAAAGVLANDTDIDSDPLSAVIVGGPANGTLTLNADGSFTYQANANFNGTDSFTYKANDGTADSNVATVSITVNPVNDAPVATNDSYSVNEDTQLTVAAAGVLGNDTNIDSDPLAAVLVSGPANGTLTLNADGSFTYQANANFNGTDSFTYKANDGTADSNVATVTITVNAVNDAPAATGDSYSVNEDAELTVAAAGVIANDTDIENDVMIAVLVSGPANGTLTLNSDGSFTYQANANFNGTDSFTYKANDGTIDSNVATVTITVNAVNDAPVATSDSYSVNEDTQLTIAAAGVLGNDTDIDSDPLSAVLVSGPANGTLTLNADGSFTYQANANFNGTDSFTYKANDGTADSNVATVTITVNAVNDAPVATSDSYSVNEDTQLTIAAAGVLGNDTDIDSDPLSAVLVSGPANGTLTLNADGSFTYQANANFNGTDSFTYKANDGTADSNVATVTITVNAVNDAPVATSDSYSVNEDTQLTIAAAGVLGNDTDIDSDPLSAVLVSGPANGTLTLNADGSFTYQANANFNGTDSFTYKANDGTADSNVAIVTITVNAVNDAPVSTSDSYSVNEDTQLTVAAAGVLGNDTDIDSDPLSAVLVSGPANGTLTLNADGSFAYQANANFNGIDSFTYKANDGSADSNIAMVTITVNAVNDAPVATNDTYSVNEDTQLTVPVAGVLGNDTDIDSDPLSAVLVSGPANGTLTLNADGSFTYQANANFNGIDSFTYKANDGTADSNVATVAITVNAVNDAPVATSDSYSVNEDTQLTVAAAGVLANDTDIDSDPLSAVLVSGPANGTLTLNADGSFTYQANANFNGADSFTYKANDGTADSNVATVTITVNAVNDAPVATIDSYSLNEDSQLTVAAAGVLGNDTDIDSDPLSAVLVSGPANGTLTLNADGSFSYQANANFNGTDSFTYKASDGTADSNVATVSINVNPVNDAPVATNDSYSVNEDTQLTVAAAGVLGNDTDIDSDPLSAVLVSGPANGTLTLNADGSFSYQANANFNGTDSFTYKANDGTADSNVATVTITVNAVNDAPVATNDSYSVNEDTQLTIAAAGVLANDTDIESDTLSALLMSGPANGTLTLNADGSFTYQANANFNGIDSFTYKANDGSADSNVANVTITVNAVNDAPVATSDSYTVNEDTQLIVAAVGVLANDTDNDSDPLLAVLVSGPANGTLTLNSDGSFTYEANANFNGTDSFTYKASDGTAESNAATVTITVNAVNDAPAATNDSYSVNEDTQLTVSAAGVLVNDTDIDSDPLAAVLISGPANGTLTLNADGSFTYQANADFNGTDSFAYKTNDGTADSNAATVTITVNAVNDAPVATSDSYSVNEDTQFTIAAAGVLGNDTDIDSDPLSAVLVNGPANGTLTLNADGSFTYQANANFNGTDSFTYKANDGSADSNVATVTITVNAVNNAPVATSDSYSVNEDTQLAVVAAGVLGNDTDIDSDPLSAVLVSGPANGTLTLNADGSFTYQANANFNGTDSFTYKVNDGNADSNVATVTITVNAVNDATVATDDGYSVNEDAQLTIAAAGVLANDSDVENDGLSAFLVSGPASGTLALNADGSFTYQANANFNGTDSFTYKANDGTADSNVATVTITVNPVNDAPVVTNDSYSVNEDTQLTVPVAGVLANDTDIDTDPLLAVLVSGPSNGTLTLNADGSFTYQANTNFNGTDSFTYKANDGTADSNVATVTITVNAVNDAPVATGDSYSVNEDIQLVVTAAGVLANDGDIENDVLNAVLVSGPSSGTLTLNAGGSFTYQADANFNGTDSFTYKANDGTADSNVATVTVTVNAVNDAPVATNDSYSVIEDTQLTIVAAGVLTNDTDIDVDPLTVVLVSGPANGTLTLNADGSLTYQADANFNGIDTFTYRANDGITDSNVATVTITVSAVNDAPVTTSDSYSVNEDSQLSVAAAGILANDSDTENDILTAVLVSGPANGTLTLNADGSFNYQANANFNGSDAFTYKTHDGTVDGNLATVTITVNPVNDAPVASNDSYSVNEDSQLIIAAAGVVSNDTDIDVDPLSAILVSGPSNGTLTFNADGSYGYQPNANFIGTDSFTYKLTDGSDESNAATVTISVNAVNDAPVATDDSYSINEDTQLIIAAAGVFANDTDIDSDPLAAVLVTGPSNGTLTLNANGSFTYQANANFNGTDSFTYKANDGIADSNVATVTIAVHAVNNAPVATNDSYAVNEDVQLTVAVAGMLSNDMDIDGDPLSAVLVSGPASGTLTLNADGSFSYQGNANFNGSDSFTYKVNDGTADSNVATITITVNAVNDAPVATSDSYSVNEDTQLTIATASVLSNDADVENNVLTTVLVSGPANGTLTLNVDGSFSYQASLNFNGTDSFTYKANDGTADSNLATVIITVNPVNDAPMATNDSYAVNEDVQLTVAVAGSLSNDMDIDGDSLSVFLVSGPANGTLNLNADGSFTYLAYGDFNGTDSFTYRTSDGTVSSNTASVTITVIAVNDAPVAGRDTYAISNNSTLIVAPAGVLLNDSDVEGDPLHAVMLRGPSSGTVHLNGDGSFVYTPDINTAGTITFAYQVSDGHLASSTTITIEVLATAGPISSVEVGAESNVADTPNELPAEVPIECNDCESSPRESSEPSTEHTPTNARGDKSPAFPSNMLNFNPRNDLKISLQLPISNNEIDVQPSDIVDSASVSLARASHGVLQLLALDSTDLGRSHSQFDSYSPPATPHPEALMTGVSLAWDNEQPVISSHQAEHMPEVVAVTLAATYALSVSPGTVAVAPSQKYFVLVSATANVEGGIAALPRR